VIPRPLALRLVGAAGAPQFRAHSLRRARLGAHLRDRASSDLDDLEAFCAALAAKVR
jgi:hypothetical protein